MAIFLFFLLAFLCVGSILAMIISRNQAHNALFLVLAFASLAGLFGLLDAPFIAAIQVIIYAGAIMVLFLFVIMMINLKEGIPAERKRWTVRLSIFLALLLFFQLALAIRGAVASFSRPSAEPASASLGSVTELGRLLFTDYLYPFEITSLLIIAALVGAMVLVKKKDGI